MAGITSSHYRTKDKLPVQRLLEGQYLRITKLHKNLNDLSVIPHRHDHYELLLVTKGHGAHSIDFKTFDIKPRRVYFLHPGQVHLIGSFDRDGWLVMFGEELFKRFLSIHQHEDEEGLLAPYAPQPYIDLNKTVYEESVLLIERLQRELIAREPDTDIILHYICILLLQMNKTHRLQHPVTNASLSQKALFFRLKRLVETHFRSQHFAGFYAKELRSDIKKLNHICRSVTGYTVFEFLQGRLLTESKILLQTSAKSIKEVSYELGFNDPSFFGRFFKKHTKITPAAFRKTRMI